MKRSEFLKRLGMVAVAIPLAPKVAAEVAELIKEETTFLDTPDTPEVYFKETIGFEGSEQFSHYEEPWIHDSKPWPLWDGDIILRPNEKVYVVTNVWYGAAVLTPYDARDEFVIVHKGDEMLRIPNFNIQL